jgi:hypothetical protein
MEVVTDRQQMSIKIELIFHAFPAALAAREIDIEQTEPGMEGGNEPALHVEERHIEADPVLQAGTSQEGCYATTPL